MGKFKLKEWGFNRVAIRTWNGIELCSGIGWLGIGLQAGCEHIGIDYRTVCHVERDAYAASVIVARMADESLDRAVVWDDLKSFDGRAWSGRVDCVTAGFPCQPWSAAGKQKGIKDERWLWPAIVRVIADVEPAIVFLENVPGLISGGGLEYVLSDLAAIGFDAEWVSVSAAEVGASHKRERVFILAYTRSAREDARSAGVWSRNDSACESGKHVAKSPLRGQRELRQSSECDGQSDGSDGVVGDPQHGTSRNGGTGEQSSQESGERRRLRGPVEPSGVLGDSKRDGRRVNESRRGQDRGSITGRAGATVADASEPRPQGIGLAEPQRRRVIEPRDRDWPIFAPGPSDPRWREILGGSLDGRLPTLTDEAYDCRAPAIKPGVCLLVDGQSLVVDASRADQLRCGGNGVVALQAAVAFVELVRRIQKSVK